MLEDKVEDLDAEVADPLLERLTFQTSNADDGSDLAAAVKAAEAEMGDGDEADRRRTAAGLPLGAADGDART